jgi:hypothetical protein
MLDFDFLYSSLVEKHGSPDDESSLIEYVEMILNYKEDLIEENVYCEFHHILPRSQFPEYIGYDWNLIRLSYKDHIKSHELLAKSFNLKCYLNPLRFMRSKVSKDSSIISSSSKKGWISLKNNKEKYEKWRNRRIEYMKNESSEFQSNRAKKGWDNEDKHKRRSIINKENWTPELKKSKSEQMKSYFLENEGSMTDRLNKRWSTISEEDKLKFIDKMKSVNSDIEKRERASLSLKEKWKNEEYREKMSNRKTRSNGYFCISPLDEVYYFETLAELRGEFNFNLNLVRSYLDTDEPVKEPLKQKDREPNQNTIGWKFYTKSTYNLKNN